MRKMRLGVASGWSPWQPSPAREHAPYDYELNARYWPKPYERFFERIDIRRRYKAGPRPWAPGRYRTSRWQPYTGRGRFSGLSELMRGHYHAERYTGERVRPEDYFKRHGQPGEYERQMADTRRKTAWLPEFRYNFDLAA